MARPGGLGKGLSALIPMDAAAPTAAADASTDSYQELPLDAVVVNQYQPRRHFDEEALDVLTASIAEFGVLQPVVVRPADDPKDLVPVIAAAVAMHRRVKKASVPTAAGGARPAPWVVAGRDWWQRG